MLCAIQGVHSAGQSINDLKFMLPSVLWTKRRLDITIMLQFVMVIKISLHGVDLQIIEINVLAHFSDCVIF